MSGYQFRMKTARIAGYDPPVITQGTASGVSEELMLGLLNCFAKASRSASDCSVFRYLKSSVVVFRSMVTGVELPSDD